MTENMSKNEALENKPPTELNEDEKRLLAMVDERIKAAIENHKNTEPEISPALLKRPQVAKWGSVSTSGLDKLVKDGAFLPPLSLADKCKRWNKDELKRWAAQGCPPMSKWRVLRG